MDLEKAVDRQRRFFDSGRTIDYSFRKTALLKLQISLSRYENELCKALYKDLHKSSAEAMMSEIGQVRTELRFHIQHLREWMRTKKVATPLFQFPAKSYIFSRPYGVSLIMAPWNYPVLLCLDPLISAIAAGNCVVLKPSAYAPSVAKVLMKMLEEIYPAKYVLVVEGGREENHQLLRQHFDKIFFTGGATVGRMVQKQAAEHLTPVTLELGGKSPCIVDETANIRLAARRIAFGKILNSGQTCVAPDYLLIQESVKEKFLACYKKEIYSMLGHEPLENPNYPRIVNVRHYKRIMQLMQRENIRIGGYGNIATLQIEPTVVDQVTLESDIMKEEVFGPVLPVLTFRKMEEVRNVVRQFEKPLACYVFTRNRKMMQFILKNLSFGGGCINDTVMHLVTPHMGFGGVGASGMGTYHGKAGFDCFSHIQGILKQSDRIDNPVRYHPYNEWKDRMVRLFL